MTCVLAHSNDLDHWLNDFHLTQWSSSIACNTRSVLREQSSNGYLPTLLGELNLYGSTAQLRESSSSLPAFRRDRSLDRSFSSCTLQMRFESSRRTGSKFMLMPMTSRFMIIQFSQVRPSCYSECLPASRTLQSGCLRTDYVSTHQRQNWYGSVLPEDSSSVIWMTKWFYQEPLFDRSIVSGTSVC